MPAPKGFQLPASRRMKPRWLIASVGVHLVALLVLLRMYPGFLFGSAASRDVVAIALPAMGGRVGRPHPAPPAARPGPSISAPRLAAPPRATAPISGPVSPDSGTGGGMRTGRTPLVSSPLQGDTRLYVGPMYIPEGGGRAIDMDSVVRHRLIMMADMADSVPFDSLAPLRPQYRTPRWTFDRNGKTYGIDANGIHFGTFTIPTAVLALLNVPQGNIDQARANARLMDMRSDILRAAARAEAEDDFRRAVAQIRERKDRERREQHERDRQRARDNDRPLP